VADNPDPSESRDEVMKAWGKHNPNQICFYSSGHYPSDIFILQQTGRSD
jgi:hypothetical protein